jgi:hypothetical protein
LIGPGWLRPELRFSELGIVEVDGRRCHAVEVYASAGEDPAQRGLLYTLAVDAEFGIIMRLRDGREDYETELADVEVNMPLDEGILRLDRNSSTTSIDSLPQFTPPGLLTLARSYVRHVFRKGGR